MTDQIYGRRRESDRAEERASRAALLGDRVAYIVATAQAAAARRRREEWAEREAEKR